MNRGRQVVEHDGFYYTPNNNSRGDPRYDFALYFINCPTYGHIKNYILLTCIYTHIVEVYCTLF